ncbi:MAG: hypothetical protein ACI92N_002458 [Pseudomonadales bacterium]|jgi:hypothetical protein
MRFLFVLFLSLLATFSHAETSMECERFTVSNNQKEDRTFFRLTLSLKESALMYEKLSGRDWFLPSPSSLQPIWISEDGLRVVTKWVASDYGSDEKQWSPVHIIDIDFGDPDFRESSHGGFADFAEIVSSPWKTECKRLN